MTDLKDVEDYIKRSCLSEEEFVRRKSLSFNSDNPGLERMVDSV